METKLRFCNEGMTVECAREVGVCDGELRKGSRSKRVP